MASNPSGRPTVMTDVVIGKLEEAFALDATIGEACFFAGINPDTYYEYVKNNPAFSERVKALRQKPVLAARRTVINAIDADPKHAQWYLERKKKDEFAQRQELAGGGDDPIRILLDKYGLTSEVKDAGQSNDPVQGSPESSS